MRTEFTVEEMTILPGGKVVVVGTSHGPSLEALQRGQSVDASIEVEIASVAVVDPPPKRPEKQMLSVRVLRGDSPEMKEITLIFEKAG
jgi:hypothetical protein